MSNNLTHPPRADERGKVPWNGIDVLFILFIWRLLLSAPVMSILAAPLEHLGLRPASAHYTAAFLVHLIQLVVIGLVVIRMYHLSWTAFGFRSVDARHAARHHERHCYFHFLPVIVESPHSFIKI